MSGLAEAVLRLAPLDQRLPRPFVLPARPAPGAAALDGLFRAAALRPPRWADPDGAPDAAEKPGVFDRIADATLRSADPEGAAGPESGADPEGAVRAARATSVWGLGRTFRLHRPDGLAITGLAADGPQATPVLLLGAPGLPLELLEGWIRALAPTFPVAAAQTRGLFGPPPQAAGTDPAAWDLGVAAQVADSVAVLDELGWPRAHVLGLCGGAALALALAAEHPDRVGGLSLWLGDYEIGSPEAKTDHQRNLQALMDMAVAGTIAITTLHASMVSTISGLSDPDLAPLAVYPYAEPDLLAIYCRMNAAVMGLDCRPLLPRIAAAGCPAQVVTSTSDTTVHPAGSEHVARGLGAPLTAVTGHDHLGIFRAPESCVARAVDFLAA